MSARDGGKWKRWRGVAALVRDATVHGSRAVEKVQLETAGRPFWILEKIPAIAAPTRVVHLVHDVTVSGVHLAIRAVAHVVVGATDLVLQAVDEEDADHPKG